MKFPGGNQLLFCEQVGTVTSFFEQWNDCERTVVLYALLKRVPFANLKFLQLSIDYNLAQNYSSQSKLQLLETHANNANFLNKLVQRYQTTTTSPPSACCVGGGETGNTTLHNHNHNNNNTSIANNNLTISDSSCDSEKKNSTFDLSSTSSSSCSSTSGVSCVSSSSSSQKTTSSLSSSSSSTSTTSSTAGKTQDKVPTSNNNNNNSNSKTKPVESKKDILNDMLTYLPLLKPGNDDVKSVYMSLIPAAVEDACQQTVPTELVQHILSYLLIHPAVNNDDRRSLSYWLRHLEEHIATSYIPTTLASSAATATTNNNNNNNNKNPTKMVNSNSTYFIHPPASQQQQLVGGSNQNLTCKTSSQQSLQFLATGPWQQIQSQQSQHHHQIGRAHV